MHLKMITICAIAGLLGCCSKDRDSTTDAAAPEAGKPPAVEGVAVVDGQPIGKQDFLFFIEPYAPHMKDTLAGRERILQRLIDQILLEREARRLRLHEEDRFEWEVQEFKRNLLITRLAEVASADQDEVTEQTAKEYFDTHPEDFDRPEQVQLKHILVESAEKARDVMERLKAGEPFDKLVREESIDVITRKRGGSLGLITREKRPYLAKAGFALSRPGEIAGPIQSPAGIHIIQLVQKIPAKKESFEDIKSTLIVRLQNRRIRDAKRNMLKTLRQTAPVEVNREMLQQLDVPLEP